MGVHRLQRVLGNGRTPSTSAGLAHLAVGTRLRTSPGPRALRWKRPRSHGVLLCLLRHSLNRHLARRPQSSSVQTPWAGLGSPSRLRAQHCLAEAGSHAQRGPSPHWRSDPNPQWVPGEIYLEGPALPASCPWGRKLFSIIPAEGHQRAPSHHDGSRTRSLPTPGSQACPGWGPSTGAACGICALCHCSSPTGWMPGFHCLGPGWGHLPCSVVCRAGVGWASGNWVLKNPEPRLALVPARSVSWLSLCRQGWHGTSQLHQD